jgi:hypothetical protein
MKPKKSAGRRGADGVAAPSSRANKARPTAGTPETTTGNQGLRVTQKASSKRRSRALQIVFGETPIIRVGGPIWSVPSESTCKTYVVNMERLTCECPYWRNMHSTCKHIEAVRIFQARTAIPSEPRYVLKNKYKNEPWLDRVEERQFEILVALLRSLGESVSTAETAALFEEQEAA